MWPKHQQWESDVTPKLTASKTMPSLVQMKIVLASLIGSKSLHDMNQLNTNLTVYGSLNPLWSVFVKIEGVSTCRSWERFGFDVNISGKLCNDCWPFEIWSPVGKKVHLASPKNCIHVKNVSLKINKLKNKTDYYYYFNYYCYYW